MATHTIVTIAQSSQGELLAQDRQRTGQAGAGVAELEVMTPHGISNFSQDEEAAPRPIGSRFGKAAKV